MYQNGDQGVNTAEYFNKNTRKFFRHRLFLQGGCASI